MSVKTGLLRKDELEEADRIVNLAFGTFFGAPNPLEFMGDRNFMTTRFRSPHVRVLAAREGTRLIGSNVLTRWGSFAYFGPLTVLPEHWNQGVAQRLLEATMKTFDAWGVRHTGLYTFPQSAKHVGLYQKFGYWPCYLTAVMTLKPGTAGTVDVHPPVLLSTLKKSQREDAIEACRRLTNGIYNGLDVTGEIQSTLAQRTGEVVLSYSRKTLDGFAICLTGPGTEGGGKLCYVKFAAARRGADAGERFDKVLKTCEAFAASRGVDIEAGVNLAREDAFRRMRAHGFRVTGQGVAMQRPRHEGFNRVDAYVIDDWR